MNRALVLQHIRREPPGLFSGMLDDRGVLVETIELDEGGELPDWREADLVVAMGGPMSVRDEIEHPRLAGEKRWIAATVRVGVPYFGVCLGAQLLAVGSDAPVYTVDTGFEILAAGFVAAQASMARSAALMFTGGLDRATRAVARRAATPGCDCRLTPKTQ